jgi:hypothetical protein
MPSIVVTAAVSQALMSMLKAFFSLKSSSMFVIFETSQTPMAPYSSSAKDWPEIHEFTAATMLPTRLLGSARTMRSDCERWGAGDCCQRAR